MAAHLNDRAYHPDDPLVQVEDVYVVADGLAPALAGAGRHRHDGPVAVRHGPEQARTKQLAGDDRPIGVPDPASGRDGGYHCSGRPLCTILYDPHTSKLGASMSSSVSLRYPSSLVRALYGISAGRCMFPGCEVAITEDVPNILEVAKIFSESVGGPRYDASLSRRNIDRPGNLMLLCPSHHLLIDTYPDQYPATRLAEIRANHIRRIKVQLDTASPTTPLSDIVLEQSGALGAAYHAWLSDSGNSSEEHWQKIFSETPACFMPVLDARPYLLKGKAYVGGKNFDNHRGNILDFLAFHRANVACIEIKTPTADLMGDSYRTNSYLPSKDLAGGVAQVLESRRSLLAEFGNLSNRSLNGESWKAHDPTCFLIIGNNEVLPAEKVSSFELYRRNLRDVALYTFDEVFGGIATLLQAVAGS